MKRLVANLFTRNEAQRFGRFAAFTTGNTPIEGPTAIRILTDQELNAVVGGIDEGGVTAPNKPKAVGRA